MNKDLEEVLILLMSLLLFWFGMIILIIGRIIYGPDASLLWASGIITWMSMIGISNFILYLWRKRE